MKNVTPVFAHVEHGSILNFFASIKEAKNAVLDDSGYISTILPGDICTEGVQVLNSSNTIYARIGGFEKIYAIPEWVEMVGEDNSRLLFNAINTWMEWEKLKKEVLA
ncbi:MAG: hypothetical protein WBB28_20735 [Crinalium sp.]